MTNQKPVAIIHRNDYNEPKEQTNILRDLIKDALLNCRHVIDRQFVTIEHDEKQGRDVAIVQILNRLEALFLEREEGLSGAEDAYFHACSGMKHWQAKRAKAGKEIGTEGSLCDGIAWLFDRIEKLEAKLVFDMFGQIPTAQSDTKDSLAVQPPQGPVAIALNTGTRQGVKWLKNVEHGESLYTTQIAAQRQWAGLTDDDISTLWSEFKDAVCLDHKTWAKAIEAKLREKNT